MANTPDSGIPTIQKKAAPPPGILPRNAQAWLIGGISLLMVLVIAFSGRKETKEPRSASETQKYIVNEPTDARIREYQARIEEEARKLAAEQAQLARSQAALGLAPGTSGSVSSYSTQNDQLAHERRTAEDYSTHEKSWIETDREKREYQSLFASNVALTYRQATKPTESATSQGPTVSKMNSENRDTNPVSEGAEPSKNERAKERDRALDRSEGKSYRLFEGTVFETVLTNRLDGSFSGPVNCMVTTNVYSHDGQRLLIPQGSRVMGEAKRVEALGQERLAVVFHRLVMPDGYSVSLDQFHGLNQIGETGLIDQINHHYMQIFGVSLAIGAIAGLNQANTSYGTNASGADAYRQGVTNSLSQSSLHILDRFLNVLPTITIREGLRVKVYLSDDLLLPAYEKHQMPSDL